MQYFESPISEGVRRNGLDEPDYRTGRLYTPVWLHAQTQKPRIIRGIQRVKSMKAEIFNAPLVRKSAVLRRRKSQRSQNDQRRPVGDLPANDSGLDI